MESITTRIAPLIASSLPTSGAATPRMSLSRESSMSTISLYESLDQVRKQSVYPKPGEPLDLTILPNEILLAILAKVSQMCNRSGKMSDLLNCTMVDKRYH
jgi:hypothetical protein